MPSAAVVLMHSCIILRKSSGCINARFFANVADAFKRDLVFDVKKRYQDGQLPILRMHSNVI